jgi:hypothetical protein
MGPKLGARKRSPSRPHSRTSCLEFSGRDSNSGSIVSNKWLQRPVSLTATCHGSNVPEDRLGPLYESWTIRKMISAKPDERANVRITVRRMRKPLPLVNSETACTV